MGKLNMEAIQKAKQRLERQGGGNGAAFDKIVSGKNIRRILWPKGDNEICYTEGSIHFGLGEDGKTSMVCRKTANPNNRCPICEYMNTLQRSKNKIDKKLADTIKPRKRIYFNVLDRDNKIDGEEEIKIMAVGVTVQRQIVGILCDPDYGDITDFETGRDITIRRSGQGLNTEYSTMPKPQPTPASTTMTKEEIENAMPDLDALWNIPSIEDMENFLNGENGDDEDFDPQSTEGDARNTYDEDDYDDMELSELKELCIQRDIQLPEKISKLKLIALLTQYDSQNSDDSEEDDDGDDVKSAISSALNRRK